jgi:alkanesulfonate monooxygenase SsuD/methylene tetrahydromethanopterin reductase-like flavin-dependent oxidoreductase (luciferase family)
LTIPVAARVADVWHAFDEPEALPHKLEVLAAAAKDAGRDPAGIRKATNLPIDDDWDVVVDRAHALHELGFEDLVVPWPAGGEDRVEEFAHRVMPRLLGRASVA